MWVQCVADYNSKGRVMKPTAKLRFVERDLGYTKIRVLQQWWEEKQWAHDVWITVGGEWRDVPLEEKDETHDTR